jgi:hypothetical protein
MLHELKNLEIRLKNYQKKYEDSPNFPEDAFYEIFEQIGYAERYISEFDWQEYHEGEKVKIEEARGDFNSER